MKTHNGAIVAQQPRGINRSSVEKIESEVKIRCEQHPDQIRDLEQSRRLVEAIEAHRHRQYQQIEQEDPHQCEQPPLQREEGDRPQQVEDQLGIVDQLRPVVVEPAQLEATVADAHQRVQPRPHDGKEDRRRRESGLGQTVEGVAAPREQSDRRPEGEGDEDVLRVGFDL